MAADASDHLVLTVPDDPRYLGVVVVTMAALAQRAGIDKDDLAGMWSQVEAAIGARLGQGGGPVTLRYEVGDGFLGVRLLDGDGTRWGTTS
jgi:hypothetical protein